MNHLLSPTDITQITSAIGTMIAAIVAVVAAVQSYRSAKQNNETNEQMIRPRVVVTVRSTKAAKNFIELVVLNDGGGLARDIKLRVLKDDLELMHQKPDVTAMSDLRVFKRGIAILPSGGEREYFILSVAGIYEEILKKQSTVAVQYKDATGKKHYNDEFVLDFASLSESHWTTEEMKAPKTIADELKKMRVAVEKMEKKK